MSNVKRMCVFCSALLVAGMASSVAVSFARPQAQPSQVVQAPAAAKPPVIPADTSVVKLPSGISYCVLAAGVEKPETARLLRAGDHVTLNYNGWLPDGTLFESTFVSGDPCKTWVGKSIEAWNQVLPSMCVGARWKLTVPKELTRGAEGALPSVPADSALIFELEVIDAIFVPEFHAARPEHTKVTASGLKWEILRPGLEDQPLPQDRIVVIDYGLWNTSGLLLDSAARNGARYEVKPEKIRTDFDYGFLKEAVSLLRLGSRVRVEVPPQLCFLDKELPGLPPNSVTVWELEALRVITPLPLPEFVLPEEAKCKRTESGLLYEVVREGTGPKPQPGGKLRAHYATWLVTGKLFDASFDQGVPARIDLADKGILPGIREALLLMPEGSILRGILPAELAYGGTGWPPHIGPFAKLVFYLELVSAH